MKEVCKYDAGRGKTAKANSYGVQWMKEVNRKANRANLLHDSSGASELLVAEQDSIYKTRPAVPVSVPTLFATNLFVLHGIQNNQMALQIAVKKKDWPSTSTGKGPQVREVVENST